MLASRPLRLLLLLALLLATVGCRQGQHHDHDHDHEHAEHVDPAHRPRDFPTAVSHLIAGHEALGPSQPAETLESALAIQIDLAKWLPEIAADSEMPEGPWDRVDALASRLLALYQAADEHLDARQAITAAELAPASPLLDELRTIRDTADPAWFATPARVVEGVPSAEPPAATPSTVEPHEPGTPTVNTGAL